MNQMPKAPQYVTYVPNRGYTEGSSYKYHKKIGDAKNAIYAGGWGNIYQWDEELKEYHILFEVKQGTPKAHMPWK